MERKKIIAGNWKMHKTLHETKEYIAEFDKKLQKEETRLQVALAVPYTSIMYAKQHVPPKVWVGAQNMHYQKQGAFTGEISPEMLHDVGADFVLIGHSERRKVFKEDQEIIAKKLCAAVNHSLVAFLCVGETEEERAQNTTNEVLKKQIQSALKEIAEEKMHRVVIAYEPVWAIGTGKSATADQAQEAHHYIRSLLKELFNDKIAETTAILYGGSVKPETTKALMEKPDIDGALVGGASLQVSSFIEIIKQATEVL